MKGIQARTSIGTKFKRIWEYNIRMENKLRFRARNVNNI